MTKDNIEYSLLYGIKMVIGGTVLKDTLSYVNYWPVSRVWSLKLVITLFV